MAKKEDVTFLGLLSSIKSKNFKPIYVLHGEESYYIDRLDCVEVDESCIGDAIHALDDFHDSCRDIIIDRQHHKARAFDFGLADLHGRNIDAVIAEQGTDRTDDAWAVDMRAD